MSQIGVREIAGAPKKVASAPTMPINVETRQVRNKNHGAAITAEHDEKLSDLTLYDSERGLPDTRVSGMRVKRGARCAYGM